MSYVFQRPIMVHGQDESDTTTATLLVANEAQVGQVVVTANGVSFALLGNAGAAAVLDLGLNQTRDPDAGKIAYGLLTPGALDVVGGGAAAGTRTVRVWDSLATGSLSLSGLGANARALVLTAANTVANSIVTAAELDALAGVTSSIQSQLDARANLAGATFSGAVGLGAQTASRALALDASKYVVASATTDTELGYLSGVTSAVQTQINARANLAGAAFGGAVSAPSYAVGADGTVGWGTSTIKTNMLTLYGSTDPTATDVYGLGLAPGTLRFNAGSTGTHAFYAAGTQLATMGTSEAAFSVPIRVSSGSVVLSTQTASRAAALDASKNIVASTTTDTELGYLSGVTSAVQTQLDARANTLGATFTGTVGIQNNVLDLGVGQTRETNAGKIGYQTFTPGAVDIVGAGTSYVSRKVKIWDDLVVHNTVTASVGLLLPSLTTSRALAIDNTGTVVASNVTTAQLECLVGVTSNIQAQIDAAGAAAGANLSVNIQEFTTPGSSTWTKPANAKLVMVICHGGGGGGGCGYRGNTAATGGGGGGSAGGTCQAFFLPDSLSGTESVVVGAGGVGGIFQVNSGNGVGNGVPGNTSYFGTSYLCVAFGGRAGNYPNGSGLSGVGGVAVNQTAFIGGSTGLIFMNGAGGNAATTTSNAGIKGGIGAGGGASGAPVAAAGTSWTAGGVGGKGGVAATSAYLTAVAGGGGTAGTGGVGGNGGNGANAATYYFGGDGGGGGGNGTGTTTGGKGGSGGYPGGGGGGGGSSNTGATGPGNGGNGASGYVLVATFF